MESHTIETGKDSWILIVCDFRKLHLFLRSLSDISNTVWAKMLNSGDFFFYSMIYNKGLHTFR